jgi:hypothetical protein
MEFLIEQRLRREEKRLKFFDNSDTKARKCSAASHREGMIAPVA